MLDKSTGILLIVTQSLLINSPTQCAPPSHFSLISAALLKDFRPPLQSLPPPSMKILASSMKISDPSSVPCLLFPHPLVFN